MVMHLNKKQIIFLQWCDSIFKEMGDKTVTGNKSILATGELVFTPSVGVDIEYFEIRNFKKWIDEVLDTELYYSYDLKWIDSMRNFKINYLKCLKSTGKKDDVYLDYLIDSIKL